MARSVEKKTEEQEERVALTVPDEFYSAFGYTTPKPETRLHVFRVGKPPITFQYHFLDVMSEGDNSGFWVIFRGAEKAWKLTVEGRNLWEGYDLLTQHRQPLIRELAIDRDFDDDMGIKGRKPKAVINRIMIEDVTPKEEK